LERAIRHGDLRDDTRPQDVLDMAAAIAWIGEQPDRDPAQRDRLLELLPRCRRFAQAIIARSADCVGSSDQPIAHSSRVPFEPRMNVAVFPFAWNWWNFNISTAMPRSWSIAVSAAIGPVAAAVQVPIRSPTAIAAW
jgi:hypothetical protein